MINKDSCIPHYLTSNWIVGCYYWQISGKCLQKYQTKCFPWMRNKTKTRLPFFINFLYFIKSGFNFISFSQLP